MWIFTREGFFSVTDNKRDKTGTTVMVRARVRDDLVRLMSSFDTLSPMTADQIIETPRSDYRYRIIVPREQWADYLRIAALELDYTNVKGTLAPIGERHTAMMRCWSAMGELQPGGPYGRGSLRGNGNGSAALYDDVKGLTAAPAKKASAKSVMKRTSKVVVSQGKKKTVKKK